MESSDATELFINLPQTTERLDWGVKAHPMTVFHKEKAHCDYCRIENYSKHDYHEVLAHTLKMKVLLATTGEVKSPFCAFRAPEAQQSSVN